MKNIEIEKGINEAYKKAGNNAYFGNGFRAGIEFAQIESNKMAALLKKIFDSTIVSGPEVAKIVTTTDTIIELESLINEMPS